MKIYTIISAISAFVSVAQAECWSSAVGYECCQSCNIRYEDQNGKWGIENNKWCGIDSEKCGNNSCWTQPYFPCCKDNVLVVTDHQGEWGYENGNWCGISRNNQVQQSVAAQQSNAEQQSVAAQQNNVAQQSGDAQQSVDAQQSEDAQQNPQQAADLPVFSMESGFYEEKEGLSLALTGSGTVYYTLDSSDPTTSASVLTYSEPIKMYDHSVDENVYSNYQHQDDSPFSTTLQNPYTANPNKFDKVTVVRAAVKLNDGSWSPVVTKTFVIMSPDKLQLYQNIPVVSLVTDPSNLYDKDKGLYVCGQQYLDWKSSPEYNPEKSEWDADNVANFYSKGKEWERDANVSIFRNGKEELNQDVGIRLKGASTRNHQTKSFNIFARKKYGDSKIRYAVIDGNVNEVTGEQVDEYDSFSIRGVYWFDRMRDAVVQKGLKDIPDIASYDSNRCVLFIDGEFWGLYDLVERASAEYIEYKYGIAKENVALIKNDELEDGSDQDLQDFKDLVDFASNNDLSDPTNYETVASKLDTESIIYHYAIGLYLGIWDWPNRNYLVYRNNGEPITGNPYSDGKWRYGSFDFDYSAGITYDDFGGVEGYAHDSFTKFLKKKDEFPTNLFSALMKNPTFYKQFAEVMNLMSQKIFEPSKMAKIVEEQKSTYMPYHVETAWRWNSGIPESDYETFKSEQNSYYSDGWSVVSEFFKNRPVYVYQFMESTYGKA